MNIEGCDSKFNNDCGISYKIKKNKFLKRILKTLYFLIFFKTYFKKLKFKMFWL